MSSLKDLASLIMVPSLVKDGRLDTVKPLGNSIIHPDATGNNDGTDGSTPAEGNFTFSRGSNLAATRVDVNGLIEKGRENLLLQSNQFDTTWVTPDATITSGQADKDGSNNAWLLTATSAFNRVVQSVSQSGVKRFSVYAKANTNDYLLLGSFEGAHFYATFNLATGAVDSNNANVISPSIENVGNGWYRCSATWVGTTTEVRIASQATSGQGGWASTTSGSVLIQDAQLEQGLVATDYIETGASTAQAGILEDLPRLDYSGGASCPSLLLEPQRSNNIPQSEYLGDTNVWSQLETIATKNEAISPEGLQNASKLLCLSGFANHQIDAINVSISSGAVTGSVYAKKGANADWLRLRLSGTSNPPRAWFDLQNGVVGSVDVSGTASIEDVGNGWYRCSLTEPNNTTSGGGGRLQIFINKSDGQTQFTSNGDEYHYIYGAQFEQGSYPTSYIPTYGSAVTRSYDLATTPSNTFDSLSTFTWFFEISRLGFSSDSTSAALTLRTSSGAEQIRCHFDFPTEQIRVRDAVNGFTTIGASINVNANTYYKICVISDGITMKTFVNGTQRGGDYTIVTQHDVDRTYMDGKGFDCKQMLFFPTALTDSECIALTTI